MKKTVRILAVSLVFIMLALVLVACKPNSDYNKAKENLEKKDYKVELTTKDVEIETFEAYYGVENVDAILIASKEIDDKVDGATIIYFKDRDSAKKAVEPLKTLDVDIDDDFLNSEYVKVTRTGKMVYLGTKNCINDTGWFFLP